MNKTLHILRDGREVSTLALANGTYTIGRDPGSDIVLADAAVSKNHATLNFADDKASIKDNNSANGIFLKGKKISEHDFSGGLHHVCRHEPAAVQRQLGAEDPAAHFRAAARPD